MCAAQVVYYQRDSFGVRWLDTALDGWKATVIQTSKYPNRCRATALQIHPRGTSRSLLAGMVHGTATVEGNRPGSRSAHLRGERGDPVSLWHRDHPRTG